ncbi:MAG: DUF4174 domain protein [Roseibaca calidilacus]|uniref:DUF4174 domain protein n=1 Tax=Roseibaca calidilacus TaxID=1666912 RepID=A0A0P7W7H0_9RHOB|nr:DUF4174 domain-containing protein [Roseibaca calidilacus]KPP90047.1 MAG: DUF4174 domain protein [Roseibaca calidilacus]CUX81152.1 protein of unknown function (DUF4174) [Roseibaca calidilacus]
MKPFLTLVFAAVFAASTSTGQNVPSDTETPPDPAAQAENALQILDAREIDVREYVWNHRLVVVMADTDGNPQFDLQLEAIRERADEFVKRDVVVIFDANPEDRSALRQVLRPNGFMTAIIDKDGEVKARRPSVRSGRELMAVIDKFPLRRQEMLERNPAGR